MAKETNTVRQDGPAPRPLDQMDRKILTALARDADRSFQALGAEVGLSAPAVHERVKRLKASGRIKGTVARVDPGALGKSFLAFVHVDVKGYGKTEPVMALKRFPEIEEIHGVAGDTCLLLKVRVADGNAMERLLEQIYQVPTVITTRSYVVLSTYLERPVQGDSSPELAPGHAPEFAPEFPAEFPSGPAPQNP